MTTVENNQANSHSSNNSNEVQRLSALVHELQTQVDRLSKALEKAEQEREWYRKAICEYEREKREFENVDIASLEAMSAGPVEPIR